MLINITGPENLLLHEVSEAASIIHKAADEEANIIFGAVLDDSMTDQVKITVIATGFDKKEEQAPLIQMSPSQELRTVEMRPEPVSVPLTQAARAGALGVSENLTPMPANFDKTDLDVPAFLRRKLAD